MGKSRKPLALRDENVLKRVRERERRREILKSLLVTTIGNHIQKKYSLN
jgi:hypothetical protein